MSLPAHLQNGLSSDGFGIRTVDQFSDDRESFNLTRNPLIASGSSSPVIDAISTQLRNRSDLPQYRFPLDLPKYNFTIIQHASLANPVANLNNVRRFITSGFRREIGPVTGVYRLPLPTRLVDSHQTQFADIAPLDVAKNVAKIGFGLYRVNRIASIAASLRMKEKSRGRVLGPKKARARAEKIDDRAFETIDSRIKKVEESGGIIDLIGALSGVKIQNAKVVSITDPQFRTFALSWNFIPRSYKESLEIQKICYNLRKNMTPVRVDRFSYVTVFPAVYTMFFQPNVQYLYKFKPCVLTSITIDYKGGSGVPAFYKPQDEKNLQSSPPESIILNTTWLELDYFVQQNYDNDMDNTPGNEDLPSNDPYGLLEDSFTFRTS